MLTNCVVHFYEFRRVTENLCYSCNIYMAIGYSSTPLVFRCLILSLNTAYLFIVIAPVKAGIHLSKGTFSYKLTTIKSVSFSICHYKSACSSFYFLFSNRTDKLCVARSKSMVLRTIHVIFISFDFRFLCDTVIIAFVEK